MKKEQRINKLEKAKAKHGKLSRVKISELQEQLKDVGTKLKQKESDYNQLKDEHEKMRLRRWKTPRCLCVFVVLLIWVVFLLLCFVATDWEYNYCSKILNWIANLDDNRKDIAKQIIFWPYLTLGIYIIYCFISLLLVKSEDEKNDWHKKFLQAIKNKMGLS